MLQKENLSSESFTRNQDKLIISDSIMNKVYLIKAALIGTLLAGCSSSGGEEISFLINDRQNVDSTINNDAGVPADAQTVTDAGPQMDVSADIMDSDVVDVSDAYTDAVWQQDVHAGKCSTYPAGVYSTPVVFEFSVDPNVQGTYTNAVAALLHPAYGPVPNNEWVSNEASFALSVLPASGTRYPAAIVFSGVNSLNFGVDADDLIVYEIDTNRLREKLQNIVCEPDSPSCEEMKKSLNVPGMELVKQWTLEYMGDSAMCTFNMPGVYNCIENDPTLFIDTQYTGSFSQAFPNEVKMFTAIIDCKN
jgi:hypothetical protein